MLVRTWSLPSAIVLHPIRFFPRSFTEGTVNGKRQDPTQCARDRHGVWRHSVPLGPWHCPVPALEGNGLVDECRRVLADRLFCDLGCRPNHGGSVFLKGQDGTHWGLVHSHLDMALCPLST